MRIDFNIRKIFIISILAICIIAINLAVFFQITEKPKEDTSDTNEEVVIDKIALTENFTKIFDNAIDYQENTVNVDKKEDMKELIYTSYLNEEEVENKYKLNVNIPYLNINSTVADNINTEINSLFYNKANNILVNTNQYTVYTVKYKVYINDNILSMIISATLKEGDNAQREIIKTYNYNLSSNEKLSINEVLEYRNLAGDYVQSEILKTIKTASENANIYNDLGYSKYIRDIDDDIYKVENTNVYFIGEDKALYIIYPYGNTNYTSELDLLVL